ncbi:MAG TPA: DUF6265 family protein [Allosphingosinicella sp.]|nr:DUF6265 family protein [Allosphingosinicella sp.]
MTRIFAAAAAAMLIAAGSPAMAQEMAPFTVDSLGWMSGTWVGETRTGWAEEHWTAPRGGMMLGLSRTGTGLKGANFEYIRIAPDGTGALTYWAFVGGRAPVGFILAKAGTSTVVFENPHHDFPQRITYRREGDAMTATISSADGSNAQTWSYRRAP